jgi:hypothetical protein
LSNLPNLAQMKIWEQEAFSALSQNRRDQARAPIEQLTKFFPQQPSVQFLKRWAALTEFDWPAERDTVSLARRSAPPDAVDLVSFHIDLPSAPSGVHEKTDYLAVAALSFEAAERKAPNARRILLTDEDTLVPEGIHAHEIIRYPLNREWPMYERMRMQERYLSTRPMGRATVFMDVDIVTGRDPMEIFAEDFDIGLTWRPEFPDAPINGGLILAGPGDAARLFFQETLRCYDALAADSRLTPLWERDLRAWWGDQFALIHMIGYHDFMKRSANGIAIDGLRIRLFPCAEYNFTPEPGVNYTAAFLASRHFLHFKGNRKPMQNWYLDLMRQGKI